MDTAQRIKGYLDERDYWLAQARIAWANYKTIRDRAYLREMREYDRKAQECWDKAMTLGNPTD